MLNFLCYVWLCLGLCTKLVLCVLLNTDVIVACCLVWLFFVPSYNCNKPHYHIIIIISSTTATCIYIRHKSRLTLIMLLEAPLHTALC